MQQAQDMRKGEKAEGQTFFFFKLQAGLKKINVLVCVNVCNFYLFGRQKKRPMYRDLPVPWLTPLNECNSQFKWNGPLQI